MRGKAEEARARVKIAALAVLDVASAEIMMAALTTRDDEVGQAQVINVCTDGPKKVSATMTTCATRLDALDGFPRAQKATTSKALTDSARRILTGWVSIPTRLNSFRRAVSTIS